MQNLIKKIRVNMKMSQGEFAEKLGIAFASVNRWENGRTVPNKLAQIKLYDLCKEYSVPVYDMILEKIDDESKNIKLEKERKLLYHGSKSGIKGKIEPKSRKMCDFGRGFYMGTDPSQALTLICDYEKSKFYIVSVDTQNLNELNVSEGIDWAMLVAYNRERMEKIKGTDFYNKYSKMMKSKDVVIGSIADDRMFYVIDNFFVGNITDKALINSLSALQLGKQYVAITQKGCDSVRIEKEVTISYLERLALKDISEANRAKGISFASDICKNYRREGLYFDEILENAKKED